MDDLILTVCYLQQIGGYFCLRGNNVTIFPHSTILVTLSAVIVSFKDPFIDLPSIRYLFICLLAYLLIYLLTYFLLLYCWEVVLSFYHLIPGDWIQVVSLNDKHPYLLTHHIYFILEISLTLCIVNKIMSLGSALGAGSSGSWLPSQVYCAKHGFFLISRA